MSGRYRFKACLNQIGFQKLLRMNHFLAIRHSSPVYSDLKLMNTKSSLDPSLHFETGEAFQAHFQTQLSALQNSLPISIEAESLQQDLFYQETQIRDIFSDLLSHETELITADTAIESHQPAPMEIIKVFEERLERLESVTESSLPETSLAAQLQTDRASGLPSYNGSQNCLEMLPMNVGAFSIANSLRSVINRIYSSATKQISSWPEVARLNLSAISPGLFSLQEYVSLIQACLDVGDPTASERVLQLMVICGSTPTENHYDLPLRWYADNGAIEEVNAYIRRHGNVLSLDLQHDRQVKAFITAGRLDEARSLVHTLESNATPPSQKTYNRLFIALLAQRGPGSHHIHALAWDMFSHMRYVAHAVPNEFIYTTMIRSIASSQDPEAERALDLFSEMTQDHKIFPTVHSYNAVMLVCARSKNYKLEAFRLARQMTIAYRDGNGLLPAQLHPNKDTFEALLEAAKRLRDLPRVRWLLGLMVKESGRNSALAIDEHVMKHVFHAYASYVPPFHREAVLQERTLDHLFNPSDEIDYIDPFSPSSATTESPTTAVSESTRRRSYPPQTHQEVIREAERIWGKIIEDRAATDSSGKLAVFRQVGIKRHLIDALMTVYFAHAPPDLAYRKFDELYIQFGVEKGPLSYLQALSAYANGQRFSNACVSEALQRARDIWQEWRQYEASKGVIQISGKHSTIRRIHARQVEEIWTGYIKLLALNWELDDAVKVVREFSQQYPPHLVKELSLARPKNTSRVSLYGDRPLVRLVEPATIPEDRIPPFLMFKDLELLHHRCIIKKNVDYIKYLSFIAHAYEGFLWQRRKAALRSSPKSHRS